MEKAQALADIRDQVDLMRVPCVRGTEKPEAEGYPT
jgi:hypothetical protein